MLPLLCHKKSLTSTVAIVTIHIAVSSGVEDGGSSRYHALFYVLRNDIEWCVGIQNSVSKGRYAAFPAGVVTLVV